MPNSHTRKTKRTPFYPDLSAGPGVNVFSVNAGYPVGHALDLADTFLDAALQTIIDAAGNLPPSSQTTAIYCAIYTLEQARALVTAASGAGVNRFSDDGQSDNPRPLTVDLPDHEAGMLACIAEREGCDLSRTASSLLGGAIRRHATTVGGSK